MRSLLPPGYATPAHAARAFASEQGATCRGGYLFGPSGTRIARGWADFTARLIQQRYVFVRNGRWHWRLVTPDDEPEGQPPAIPPVVTGADADRFTRGVALLVVAFEHHQDGAEQECRAALSAGLALLAPLQERLQHQHLVTVFSPPPREVARA